MHHGQKGREKKALRLCRRSRSRLFRGSLRCAACGLGGRLHFARFTLGALDGLLMLFVNSLLLLVHS